MSDNGFDLTPVPDSLPCGQCRHPAGEHYHNIMHIPCGVPDCECLEFDECQTQEERDQRHAARSAWVERSLDTLLGSDRRGRRATAVSAQPGWMAHLNAHGMGSFRTKPIADILASLHDLARHIPSASFELLAETMRRLEEGDAHRQRAEAAEALAHSPEVDINGPPHTHDPHGVPWRERALVRGNMLRYIAFVATGKESGDPQSGVDRLKDRLEEMESELQALRNRLKEGS